MYVSLSLYIYIYIHTYTSYTHTLICHASRARLGPPAAYSGANYYNQYIMHHNRFSMFTYNLLLMLCSNTMLHYAMVYDINYYDTVYGMNIGAPRAPRAPLR